MKKRKSKLYLLAVIFIITLSYITITYTLKDETTKSLSKLNYSNTEINLIKKHVSQSNIDYLINNNISPNQSIPLINEQYYIDNYLQKYIKYQKNNKKTNTKDIITTINTHTDNNFYTNTIKTNTSLGKYVILNKYYYTDDTYPNKDLVKVPGKYHVNGTTTKLNKECYEAFLKMYNDAYKEGYGFKIKSAYRSYKTQENTYKYWVSKENSKEKADTYSARAGFSEHQTGYAIDIRDYDYKYEDYSKSKSFKWVSKNAHKYGFIIRFPKNKEHITGYQYEPWHYRYCGVECATYIYENNITYEEYYEYFIKFNNPKNLKLKTDIKSVFFNP